MSEQEVEAMIQAKNLNAPRVTPDRINALIERVTHNFSVLGTSTFCHAFLDNRFLLATGHSACVSPENFDPEIGRKIAYENMVKPMRDKLWELEGYRLYMGDPQ